MSSVPGRSRSCAEGVPAQGSIPLFSFLLHPAISMLWEGFRLAENVSPGAADPSWNFAVKISDLRNFGLTEGQLKWLILKGYAQQVADPCQAKGAQVVEYSPQLIDGASLPEEGLLVLTRAGGELLEAVGCALAQPRHPASRPKAVEAMPHWDVNVRELWFGTALIKNFRGRADNQELVLSAFEEDGWPAHIDDPLPPNRDADIKIRLRDTICSLNRHHHLRRMKFRGDGTGHGVKWELSR